MKPKLAKFLTIASCAVALPLLTLPAARAEEGQMVGAVNHAATLKECSACHMAFQPAFLPARSWEAVMNNLSDHFGEDASLPADVAADIKAYLMANAGDAGGRSRWMRRIPADQTPLRITETQGWLRAHSDEVNPAAFTSAKVKSKANCMACHRSADKGYYEDD